MNGTVFDRVTVNRLESRRFRPGKTQKIFFRGENSNVSRRLSVMKGKERGDEDEKHDEQNHRSGENVLIVYY